MGGRLGQADATRHCEDGRWLCLEVWRSGRRRQQRAHFQLGVHARGRCNGTTPADQSRCGSSRRVAAGVQHPIRSRALRRNGWRDSVRGPRRGCCEARYARRGTAAQGKTRLQHHRHAPERRRWARPSDGSVEIWPRHASRRHALRSNRTFADSQWPGTFV